MRPPCSADVYPPLLGLTYAVPRVHVEGRLGRLVKVVLLTGAEKGEGGAGFRGGARLLNRPRNAAEATLHSRLCITAHCSLAALLCFPSSSMSAETPWTPVTIPRTAYSICVPPSSPHAPPTPTCSGTPSTVRLSAATEALNAALSALVEGSVPPCAARHRSAACSSSTTGARAGGRRRSGRG